LPTRELVVTEEALAEGVKAVEKVTRDVENPKVDAVWERIVCGFRIAFDISAAAALILLVVICEAIIVAFGAIMLLSVGFIEPDVIKRLSIVAEFVLILFPPRSSELVFIEPTERVVAYVFATLIVLFTIVW
jgi:hypothetical protein